MNKLQAFASEGSLNSGRLLPLVHVTPLSKFESIFASGLLAPQPCKIFKKDILYCSYGDIVFRPSGRQAYWDADLPVAMVISPLALARHYKFFPVDTGAIDAGRLSKFPSSIRSEYKKNLGVFDYGGCAITRFVKKLFGSNDDYRARQPGAWTRSTPDEAAAIQQLLTGLTSGQVPDHLTDDLRVITQIECHFDTPINIFEHVTYIVMPGEARWRPMLAEIKKNDRWKIDFYKDCPVRGTLPEDLVAKIKKIIASQEA